jgi:hypothetical protein
VPAARKPTRKQKPKKPATEFRRIVWLQNDIRNTINGTDSSGTKTGIPVSEVGRVLKMHFPRERLTVRAERLPEFSDLWADLKVYSHGELLFRLKLVPWDHNPTDARWHVKRHPKSDWWRGRRTDSLRAARPRAGARAPTKAASLPGSSSAGARPAAARKVPEKRAPRTPRPKFSQEQNAAYEALYTKALAEAGLRAAAVAREEAKLPPGTFVGQGWEALILIDREGPGFAEWLRQRGHRAHPRTGPGQGARIQSSIGSMNVGAAYCGGFLSVAEKAGVGWIGESKLD